MYLTYNEYSALGGTLSETAFSVCERRAANTIRAQAGGQTGARLDELSSVPQAVKDCTYDLIEILSSAPKQVSSESQAQGGASESYSYVTRSDEQISAVCESIIADAFCGGGIGHLLYRGVTP